MRISKIITVSALSVSLLGLTACGGKPTSKPTQTGSNQTSQDKGSNGGTQPASNGNGTSQTGSSQSSTGASSVSGQSGNSQQGSSSGNSSNNHSGSSPGASGGTSSTGSSASNSGQGSTSTKSGGSDQTTGTASSSSKPVVEHSAAPKTKHEALVYTKDALGTRVPLMLPNDVPVAKGQYLTSTTHSETWFYRTNFYETNQPQRVNSKSAAQGILIASVEGTEYANAASARESIPGYIETNPPKEQTVNLGHGVKALGEGATGHNYIIWNEGRWCIRLDQPTDPTYRNKTYPDGKLLAERVVAYLNKNYLPAPQKIGVITISDWDHNAQTTIRWQYHDMTYQVTSTDPFNALAVAVAMHFTSK